MIVRVSTAFAMTASMSSGFGSRLPMRRPVGWPRMSTCGFSSAAQIRFVWSAEDSLCEACTLATTTSSSARSSSE